MKTSPIYIDRIIEEDFDHLDNDIHPDKCQVAKTADSEDIAKHTEVFLANGGIIEHG